MAWQGRWGTFLDVNWESVWDVLKWVLAALVAGFIGQFGRSFAVHLMKRRREKKSPDRPDHPEIQQQATPELSPEVLIERERLAADTEAKAVDAKTAKKLAKAEVKRQKKAQSEERKNADR